MLLQITVEAEVCLCMHACVRVHVRACVYVRVCVRAYVCADIGYSPVIISFWHGMY